MEYRSEVKKLIKAFCRSFDDKDWALMNSCLCEVLEVNYESFRGTPKQTISSLKYIEKRKVGLKTLRTKHRTFNHKIVEKEDDIFCSCDFEIKRYELEGNRFLHSFGAYEFIIEKESSNYKIQKIKQTVNRTEGDKRIHGAFKK